MIKIRNIDHTILTLRAPGTVTAATAKDIAIVPYDGFISNIVAACGSGGTGATNSILDINYLGTTIFGAATKITLASTTGVASYSALSSTPYSVTAGAVLALDADQVSTTLSNVCVMITITKMNPVAATNLINHNVIP